MIVRWRWPNHVGSTYQTFEGAESQIGWVWTRASERNVILEKKPYKYYVP
jgi:hypothetical protein